MDSGVRARWSGINALQAELQLLSLTPARRKRAMSQIGREVTKQTRKNVRSQTSVRGSMFDPRKKKRTRKGKMLSGFVKGRNIRQKATGHSVEVGFRNDLMGRMANEHQSGTRTTFKAKPMSSSQKKDWREQPATRAQASAMIRLGFRVERKGGRKKRVSQAWIMKSLTRLQALGVLYKLNNDRQGKQSWTIELPAREFFANDAAWVKDMATAVMRAEYQKGR